MNKIFCESRDRDVSDVKSINFRKGTVLLDTNTFILIFKTTHSFGGAGWLSPNPCGTYILARLRCYKGQKCCGMVHCFRCAEEGHNCFDYFSPIGCINCSGSQAFFSKDCSKRLLAKILKRPKYVTKLPTLRLAG